MRWIRDHWPALLGGALVLWQGGAKLIQWVSTLDFVIERSQNPNWIGRVIQFLADPPPGFALLLILAGITLVYWDIRFRKLPWPDFISQLFDARAPLTPPVQQAGGDQGLLDDLCRLTLLNDRQAAFDQCLAAAFEVKPRIEELLQDVSCHPDGETWSELDGLLEKWTHSLLGANWNYQDCFGEDKNLALTASWVVNQAPLRGEEQMHPKKAAAQRRFYDQLTHVMATTGEMNRRFKTATFEAYSSIAEHARVLIRAAPRT